MTYVPQAGTIPAKVIAVLSALKPGQELSGAQLLEAIGQPDYGGLKASMGSALNAGAVRIRKAGLLNWWSMGSGVPLARVDSERDEPLHQVPERSTAAPSVFLAPRAAAGPAPAPAPAPAPSLPVIDLSPPLGFLPDRLAADESEPEPAPSPSIAVEKPEVASQPKAQPFACAMFSDGRLLLEIDGATKVLSKVDTKVLLHYLDRMRPVEEGV